MKQLKLFTTRQMMEASGWKYTGGGGYVLANPEKHDLAERTTLKNQLEFWVKHLLEYYPEEKLLSQLALLFGNRNKCKCCGNQELSIVWEIGE